MRYLRNQNSEFIYTQRAYPLHLSTGEWGCRLRAAAICLHNSCLNSDAVKTITKIRRQWFAKRKSVLALLKEALLNEQSVLVDSDADNKAADADAALQDLGGDYVSYGYLTTSICVMHPDAATAEARLHAIERIINGKGFVTIHETVNAVDAWLGTHPGNAYANIRTPLVSTLNLAHLMPLSAVWAGPAYE